MLTSLWRQARNARKNGQSKAHRLGLSWEVIPTAVMVRLLLLPCAYCAKMPALGIDHVVPFARGGAHEISNLAPCCRRCNAHKSVNSRPTFKDAQVRYAEGKAAKIAYNRTYWATRRVRQRAYYAEYRAAHREEIRAYGRAYYAATHGGAA